MASSSDDPTDLISFFTPEELWEDLIEDWPNQKGKPHARRLILSGCLPHKRKQNCSARRSSTAAQRTKLLRGGRVGRRNLRERLEWDQTATSGAVAAARRARW